MDNAPFIIQQLTHADIDAILAENLRLRTAVKQARYALAISFGEEPEQEDTEGGGAVHGAVSCPPRSIVNIFKKGK